MSDCFMGASILGNNHEFSKHSNIKRIQQNASIRWRSIETTRLEKQLGNETNTWFKPPEHIFATDEYPVIRWNQYSS